MSLFIAERIEGFTLQVKSTSSKSLAQANEERVFIDIVLTSGDPVWVCRASQAIKGKGILLVGKGSSYQIDNWFGDISCISEGITTIAGEIGYAE